jgi:hypothetical protein
VFVDAREVVPFELFAIDDMQISADALTVVIHEAGGRRSA